MGGLQPWHWIIVIAVFVLLFGAKKLPDAARSLGKSMRIFKSEIKEMQSESQSASQPETPAKPITSERVDTAAPAPEQSPDRHTA
ncbi:twin arginine translocase protein A [Mycolicibacterium mageritense DSM 44476 = CIP 104973]|uniref:Sec-independent protein translocase protein TatA n=1 Tax=Mycolicibacterium mageritense TaxID=53462 RepID=A0AAI8U0P5_MYCME|nr:Sec-independent protein translocase subunit TatA [Mycolicibacterium mageritense]MBN3456534.1 Sec-independent protein translocase subunit TatA [Mycobacterium sp. DSM 3803]OKH72828.1 preprotein translocase subunit TatA [Mycobacterium sp. SWH-M3]MCC9179865.1 Sec-independent protein translocase subunit TatA [Mycolicibacterium mageritense]CDO25529.1 twin arginine translocase A [Mycolicibacterium mageritense DSM 44476 = CIP 104973]BBX37803.1 Sec-independent protein translocase protein TatA [Mycol